jgi:hypothetical protein
MIIIYIMPLSLNEIRSRALEFSKEWENETRENAEAKSFWDGFFNVFGISRRRVAIFEKHVKKLGNKDGFIDLFWPGKLLVEHKSRGKSLDKAFDQATEYFEGIDETEIPRYMLISDFHEFRLYDLEKDTETNFELKNLLENIKLFDFISGYEVQDLKKEDPVNIEAAEIMGKLHDELLEVGYSGHQLEIFLVRLLFCLFAEDTEIFAKNQFLLYIQQRTASDGSDLALRLEHLFQILNQHEGDRLTNIDEKLQYFPHINGKLFEESLSFASFDKKMRIKLLEACRFDWSKISPAVFGSLFQSVMNPKLRRNLGAHYTSEENILKLIKPLFWDELWDEYDKIKHNKKKLEQFHVKISKLKFFDPACGCGNFLIIAYREIRLLELEIIKKIRLDEHGHLQQGINIKGLSRIDVDSFYGIELEEFPARIAEVAMWLMDHKMNLKLSKALGDYYVRLPLKKAANIVIGNSLLIDWSNVLKPNNNVFILGNPPFAGKKFQSKAQKADMKIVFDGVKKAAVLDYVTAWYLKAAEYIQNTQIKVGFVSTNSISQGEQVSILWEELFNEYNIKIHFAHTTFKWRTETKKAAGVYVVIIGFGNFDVKDKYIFEYQTPTSEPFSMKVKNINPYLAEGDDLTIKSRRNPICGVPKIRFGSMPNDGGNLLLSNSEKELFLIEEPDAKKYIKPLISAREFIHGQNRWCLWLKDADPSELKKLSKIMEKIQKVKDHRLKSSRKQTKEMAEYPTLFGEDRQPDNDYILIPRHSSENRKYIPIGLLSSDNIVSDSCLFISNVSLYPFGIIMSKMHMTWVNYVCGRLESRYRYSNQIVYNNFPWPEKPNNKQIRTIKEKSQKILNIREEFKDSSLADLYDPLFMPPKLRKAHQELDNAVDKAYGKKFKNDSERMKLLFELYETYISL